MKIGNIHYQLFIYKSKINLRNTSPIYCKLFSEGSLKLLSTGILINPQHWDAIKYTVKKKDELNQNLLELWKGKLHKLLFDTYVNDITPDLDKIASTLSGKASLVTASTKIGYLEVFKLFINNASKKSDSSVEPRTIQKYITVYNSVFAFFKKSYNCKDIAIIDIKIKHLLEYESFCLTVLTHKQITVNKSIQMLKQIIKYAIGYDYLTKDPWSLFKSKSVTTTIIYLTKDQLHTLDTAQNLSDKLRKICDCFLFSCYSGLGYAELSLVNQSNITYKNNIYWLKMVRKKTHKYFNIPLLPPAKAIWDKYDGNLPILSNQKYNKYLKELATTLHINAHLTTHLARKTFATTVLIGNNIPLKVVSAMLGHANTKITEKHYAEVTNELLEQHVESLNEIFNNS